MAVADYNTDPDLNTTISGINIAEGCPPSGINNAIRQMMADVKDADDADVKLSGDQTIAGNKTFSDSIIFSAVGANIKFNVDNGYFQMGGGSGGGYWTGATFSLFGKDYSYAPGHFRLYASDGANYPVLEGSPDGTLTWDSKNVVRVEDSGTGYIRYSNGTQICWGSGTAYKYGNANYPASKNYAMAFTAAPNLVTAAAISSSPSSTGYAYTLKTFSRTATGFNIYVSYETGVTDSSASYHFIAIGNWK